MKLKGIQSHYIIVEVTFWGQVDFYLFFIKEEFFCKSYDRVHGNYMMFLISLSYYSLYEILSARETMQRHILDHVGV